MLVSPVKGEMYTVTPHCMPDGSKTGFLCGTWHCRIRGDGFGDGRITVQEMKVDGCRWKPAMSAVVPIAMLRPLAVNVDLFGDPGDH